MTNQQGKDKIKLVLYTFDQPKWACAHIRLLQYLRQWSSEIELQYGVSFDGKGGIAIDEKCIDSGDIFIVQRFFPSPETRHVLEMLWASGKPVIYETDDLLTEMLAKSMGKPENAQAIMDVIEKADLVTVSTQTLYDKYKRHARNIMVVPNLIDEGLWVHKFLNKRDTDRLVIGYCGTPTHVGDLALAEQALESILKKYPDQVVLRMYGCTTERLAALPNVEYREFFDSYFDFVYQSQKTAVDIAVAPLADNIFNRCKSNIKWLEYSCRGIAGVYSNVGPYKASINDGQTGLLVDNTPESWLSALESLITNEAYRAELGHKARDYVHEHFSLNRERVDYLGILQDLLSSNTKTIRKVVFGQAGIAGMDINHDSIVTSLDLNETNDRYQLWLQQRQMSEIDAQIYAERIVNKWSHRPRFHILCAHQQGRDALLVSTLQSLGTQLYKNWHLTIVSAAPCEIPGLDALDNIDWLQQTNGVEDVNRKIAESSADWVMQVESGALFEPNTLVAFADYINANPEWVCIYSDHDSYIDSEYYQDPYLKPDINREYLLSMDYIKDAVAFRREALAEAGFYGDNGSLMNYGVVLSVLSRFGGEAIGHIENVLFHFYGVESGYNESSHRQLVQDYFQSQSISADIYQGMMAQTLRVEYRHDSDDMVSIIIPTRDMLEYVQPCVESVFDKTAYQNYEVIIVDNGSEDADVFAFYQNMREQHGDRFSVQEYPFEFNYSAMINLGVEHARGEYVLQLNNDTEVIQVEWLDRLMQHAQMPDVGVVGAKLLFPSSGCVQHAGVILGLHDIAGHPHMEQVDSKGAGYMNRAQVDQDLSAVTGACLLARKSVYQQVDGMDAESLKVCYNDIDLCLKVKEAGLRVVWSAYSILLHHGSVSQIETQSVLEKKLQSAIRFSGEQDTMIERWRPYIQHDPAYNKQLSLVEVVPQPDFGCVINWHGSSRERPRIFGLPVSGGSGQYRVKAPLRTLARAGVAQVDFTYSPNTDRQRILMLSELIRADADAIVVQNFIGNDNIDALEKYRKHAGTFITYALDDLITHLPEGNDYRNKIPGNARTRLRKALKLCDRLVVTTEPLQELCSNMIDDIVVIPNYLESPVWSTLQSQRAVSAKPRVGWAGAQQHSDDLAFIEEVVKATAHEVDWIFFGMCPNSIRPYVAEVHGFEFDFEKYASKLASLNLDLAVAPLMMHPFNEAKSNLRILEYGALAWPVVCTDILPYQNAPVQRVANHAGAWIAAIRERIHDLDAAYREGDRLREWVLNNHMLDQHVDTWSEQLLPDALKAVYRDAWQDSKKYMLQS